MNRPPTIDNIPDYGPVPENSGPHKILLTGISAGRGEENQVVTLTADAENFNLITNISINYDQGEEAELVFDLVPNANGKSNITITLNDGQIFRSIKTESFEVNVLAVNGEPSFVLDTDLITVEENSGKIEIKSFAINIDDGDPELDQKLSFIIRIESISETLSFKSEPKIEKNGALKFEVEKNTYGEASVLAYLQDDGGTKNGGDDTSAEVLFLIKVIKINSPPTIYPISSPINMHEDDGEKVILLTGISSGLNEDQQVSITTIIDNPNIVTNPEIIYEPGSNNATLIFSTIENQFGEVNFEVVVNDGQQEYNETSIKFLVIVKPVADTPTISSAMTKTGQQTTSGLVISRNNFDGTEVSHYKVSQIKDGLLYQNDGLTQIRNDQFITHQQGNAGLRFTPYSGISENGSFLIQAAIESNDAGLGGNQVLAEIKIINESPKIITIPDSVVFLTNEFSYEIIATDPDFEDQLEITMVIPEEIRFWLELTDYGDGTAQLSGLPPEGSAGIYEIKVIAKDQFGASAEQDFQLVVKSLNQPPVLSKFNIEINEDDTIFFNYDTFLPVFSDPEGDSIQLFKVESEPLYGTLFSEGKKLMLGDTIELIGAKDFVYVPDRNYYGLDVFDWNLSDGTDFAQIPQRTNILISSVFDPPEIRNLEKEPILFEYGDDFFTLTENGQIVDEDSERLEGATFSISGNYIFEEDSLYYEQIEALDFIWDDQEGVLYVNGIAAITEYQQILSSLAYINKNPLSPSTKTRQIEMVLYDSDTLSKPYYRQIEFGSSFENLNLKIPTGFTPNGDGINDIWYVENLGAYPEFKIEVYSRSGKRIFEASNQSIGWDGRYNGSLVPAGTYYYFINLSNYDRIFKGSVMVLR